MRRLLGEGSVPILLIFLILRNESVVVEEAAMQRLVSTVKSAHSAVDYGIPIILMMFLGPLR